MGLPVGRWPSDGVAHRAGRVTTLRGAAMSYRHDDDGSYRHDDDGAGRRLQVIIYRDDGTLQLRVAGDLDAATTASFRERVAASLARRPHCVELDLRDVGFCDAAGLRELLALRRRLEQQDTEVVVVVAASDAIRRVAHLLGLDGWE
jgi:anti-anti-sigma factor